VGHGGPNIMVLNRPNKLKALFICVCAITMLMLNQNSLFAVSGVLVICEKPGGNKPCGEYAGIKPYGSGGIIVIPISTSLTDFGLNLGFTSFVVSTEQVTNMFISDNDSLPDKGKGYIGVSVIYNYYSEYYDEYQNVYAICNATLIEDYNEWLEMCYHLAYSNGDLERATLYPNPTTSGVSVKLEADYISNCNVIGVTYKLYDLENVLLETTTPTSVDDIVNFSNTFNPGTYFIKCEVVKANTALNEVFTLQFIKK